MEVRAAEINGAASAASHFYEENEMSYDTYNPQHDMFFELPESMPVPGANRGLRITGEDAPVPQQQFYAVGKLLGWYQSRSGVWSGVIISNGYRWTFGAKDILCEPADLREGQQVSFRSRLSEDSRGLGAADQVKPYEPSQPRQQLQPPQPEPQLETSPERPQQCQRPDNRMLGLIEYWGDLSKTGILSTNNGEQFAFEESDVISGIPVAGLLATFRAVPGPELRHAVDIEVER
jgi:hypothetical protein